MYETGSYPKRLSPSSFRVNCLLLDLEPGAPAVCPTVPRHCTRRISGTVTGTLAVVTVIMSFSFDG